MPLTPLSLDPILEWAFEFLVKEAIKQTPRMIGKVWGMYRSVKFEIPMFIAQKGKLVGREKEIRAVRAALEGHKTQILYFRGNGGVGKTRLLEEAGKIALQSMHGRVVRWAGVIDLYHTDLRNPIHIQNQIIGMIDPQIRFFSKFHTAYQHFEKMQIEKAAHVDLQFNRSTLNKIFLETFNRFTQKRRVVFAIDTLETLGNERDPIQTAFHLRETNTTLEWLTDFLGQAQNSVFILAGRPSPDVEISLAQILQEQPGQFEVIDLQGLTREDARQLMADYVREIHTPKAILEEVDRLWKLSSGVPVQLCLAVELVGQAESQISPDDLPSRSDLFKKNIVVNLFQSENLERSPLYYLALARKGLSPKLLHYLEPDQPLEQCAAEISKLRGFSVVKVRPDANDIFLHDALYDLFDQFALGDINTAAAYGPLADFYRIGLTPKTPNHNSLQCLYYELREDPLKGFEESYLRWSEEALSGYNVEWEMQLRAEILAFLNSYHFAHFCDSKLSATLEKEFILDSAIKWVKRYLARAQHDKAMELAERLIQLAPSAYIRPVSTKTKLGVQTTITQPSRVAQFIRKAPLSFWGYLFTYYGDALIYMSAPAQEVEQVLQIAIQLSRKRSRGSAAKSWMKRRTLGWAHDRIGYLMRVTGRYDSAIHFYHQAISYYRAAQTRDEWANTLNNLAFVLAFKGQVRQARTHVENGLRLRQEIGQKHPLGLSYNTKGLIFGLNNPRMGEQECKRALSIFEEIDAPRGIGLACNALGYLLRLQGAEWKSQKVSYSLAMQCYEHALKFLHRAEEIFTEELQEPIRLWESLNETGSVFYEMGVLVRRENNSIAKTYFENSVEFHNKALKIALGKSLLFQSADTYDDLAQTFLGINDFAAAEKSIQEAIAISAELGKPFSEGNRKYGEDYWLTLAKIHQQKGFLALQRKNPSSAQEEIRIAFDYFKRFSNSTEYLARRKRLLFERLSAQGDLSSDFVTIH